MNTNDLVVLKESAGMKATPGSFAVVVDGKAKYPTLYKQLCNLLCDKNAVNEFVAIEWLDPDLKQPCGFYHKFRFEAVSFKETGV